MRNTVLYCTVLCTWALLHCVPADTPTHYISEPWRHAARVNNTGAPATLPQVQLLDSYIQVLLTGSTDPGVREGHGDTDAADAAAVQGSNGSGSGSLQGAHAHAPAAAAHRQGVLSMALNWARNSVQAAAVAGTLEPSPIVSDGSSVRDHSAAVDAVPRREQLWLQTGGGGGGGGSTTGDISVAGTPAAAVLASVDGKPAAAADRVEHIAGRRRTQGWWISGFCNTELVLPCMSGDKTVN